MRLLRRKFASWRSADSAKEVRELIDEPAEHVLAGNELAEKVSCIMIDVAESAQGAKSTMEEMLSCTEEQTRGIEQMVSLFRTERSSVGA